MPRYHVQIDTKLSPFYFSSEQGESLGTRLIHGGDISTSEDKNLVALMKCGELCHVL